MCKRKCKARNKKHNKVFDQNDLKIIRVTQKLVKTHPGNISVKQVADAVGITRQGFYEHYKSVDEAILKGGDKLMRKYRRFLSKRLMGEDQNAKGYNRKVFIAIFLHMSRYAPIYHQICAEPAIHHLIKIMVEYAYPQLKIIWLPFNIPAPRIGEERADMYVAMAVKIICEWGKEENCDLTCSQSYITRLVKLTDEASSKCRI